MRQHEVDRVTTLDGASYEITAPVSELDHFIVQKDLAIDGIPTSSVTVVEAERTDDAQHDGDAPHRLPVPSFIERDGHQLVVAQIPSGGYRVGRRIRRLDGGREVTDLSDADRARVASLFAARETADGFLVLDPAPAVHMQSEGGSDIVLDHVDIGV